MSLSYRQAESEKGTLSGTPSFLIFQLFQQIKKPVGDLVSGILLVDPLEILVDLFFHCRSPTVVSFGCHIIVSPDKLVRTLCNR